jgi:hypothetical protein
MFEITLNHSRTAVAIELKRHWGDFLLGKALPE